MRNAAPRGELFLRPVDVPQELEFVNEVLVDGYIDEDRSPAPVLGEEDGPPPPLHLADHFRDVGTELRERTADRVPADARRPGLDGLA